MGITHGWGSCKPVSSTGIPTNRNITAFAAPLPAIRLSLGAKQDLVEYSNLFLTGQQEQ
ncbi:MAG: hypothetical protein WD200_02760 [Candidatus Andersenbacteria bacterium]